VGADYVQGIILELKESVALLEKHEKTSILDGESDRPTRVRLRQTFQSASAITGDPWKETEAIGAISAYANLVRLQLNQATRDAGLRDPI
jgi:hypothetical protein